jgi:hypothetical protein
MNQNSFFIFSPVATVGICPREKDEFSYESWCQSCHEGTCFRWNDGLKVVAVRHFSEGKTLFSEGKMPFYRGKNAFLPRGKRILPRENRGGWNGILPE